MSQHPSLKGKGAIKAKRSVLKRFERVELMKKRGQFKEGQTRDWFAQDEARRLSAAGTWRAVPSLSFA